MVKANQLKTSQLSALVAVAEHGSFSEAALQLGLAQSTVSHAIATLESELGVVLLLRGRSGAVLTPLGVQICQQAKDILSLLENIQQMATQAKDLQTGRVRIATVRTVATHILPDVISRFQQQHSNLSIEISEYDLYTEVEDALRSGRADVGFTSLPTASDFQAWELFRDEFVALLPPLSPSKAHLDRLNSESLNSESLSAEALSAEALNSEALNSEPLTWEQLTSYARIANQRSSLHNILVEEHLARFGYDLPIDYAVREDSTLMGLVTKGLGAAVLSRLEAKPIPPGVRVKSLPTPLERIVGVAILESAVLPRAVFAFLDVVLSIPLL